MKGRRGTFLIAGCLAAIIFHRLTGNVPCFVSKLYAQSPRLDAADILPSLPRRSILLSLGALVAQSSPLRSSAEDDGDDADDFFSTRDFFCERCCARDWCGCGSGPSTCDCHAVLKKKGYRVPLDASEAHDAAGKVRWPEKLSWQSADVVGWRPIKDAEVEVKSSLFPNAGDGLFATQSLPKGSLLPYIGEFLTFAEIGDKIGTPKKDYVWCPEGSAKRIRNMNKTDFAKPEAQELAYCVDSKTPLQGNPGRFVNAAAQKDQCGAIDVEMCEFGKVMYFRTTKALPAGTELVTQYGPRYWKGFAGC